MLSIQFTLTSRLLWGEIYDSPFFGSANTEKGYKKRLRAIMQNTFHSFADETRKEGHSVTIVDESDPSQDSFVSEDEPSEISRSQYADKVKDLMAKNRGCELPGTYNPLVVGELFKEQCKP